MEGLRAKVEGSDDATPEDSPDVNELFALESGLEKRVKDGEEDLVSILGINFRSNI